MQQSTNKSTRQSDLDRYNLVRENSNLTHENMLFSANKFGDQQVEIGLYSNDPGQEIIARDSIGSYVNKFKRNTNQDRLSILLCSGNVKTNQDQTSNSYQELTGDSHWTTLHLRKDQEGKIHAFYSDSLSHDNNDKNTIPTSVLQALEISEIKSVNKIQCEIQPDFHKCGDHALFNALAMNQTDNLLTSNKVKDNILLVDESSLKSISVNEITVDQFYQPHRQALAQEFNVRIANYQTTQQNSSQQNHRSNTYAGTDEEAGFIKMAINKA